MYDPHAKLPSNYTIAFLIGFISAYPSLMPTVLSIKANPTWDMYKTANLEGMFSSIPIFYGFLHIVIFFMINKFVPKQFRTYWLLGFIIGLLYPTFGTISGHAKKVYGTKNTAKLYMGGQLLYLPFYGIIVNYLFNNI